MDATGGNQRRVDVHQHLLGEPLIEALTVRSRAPKLVRRRDGWTFSVPAEPDSVLAFEATDVELRRADLEADGVDRALIALSTALGIESLPRDESLPLIEAHHLTIESLPPEFGGWGAVPLAGAEPDPADVDAALDRGCVGITLPAPALADPASVERLGPLLARLEERRAPLFVHPGPTAPRPGGAGDLPHWWPALTDYVAQMQAAWFAFLHAGRRSHPTLRVLFTMLAGGAPLQLERYAARRGVPAPAPDPLVFYEISSYGPRMIDAMAAVVGASQLLYGSDRPVVDPSRPRANAGAALFTTNPDRLLDPDPKGALA